MKNFNENKDDNNPLQSFAFFRICQFNKNCQITLHPFQHIFQFFEPNRDIEGKSKSIIHLAKKFIFPNYRRSIINIEIIYDSVFLYSMFYQ